MKEVFSALEPKHARTLIHMYLFTSNSKGKMLNQNENKNDVNLLMIKNITIIIIIAIIIRKVGAHLYALVGHMKGIRVCLASRYCRPSRNF